MPGHWYEENGRQSLKDEILPALGKSPRAIWIAFGNEVKNAAYDHTWLDFLLKNTDGCDFLLVSDMRFPNEAERIKQLGGYVVRIDRPNIAPTSDAADDPLSDYTGWDFVITNTDLQKFYTDVSHVVEEVLTCTPRLAI